MFCPRCGSTQGDDLKFCKSCGANLHAVRQVVDAPAGDEKFDWSKTWVAEMFMSGEEAKRRALEMERLRGITPEVRRYQEIKAGVITSSVGVGMSVLIFVVMEGIIRGGNVSPAATEILGRLWIAGIIPLLVGIALIVNGLFVSKKIVEVSKREAQKSNLLEKNVELPELRPADTAEFIPSSLSVTEGTTKHLNSRKN